MGRTANGQPVPPGRISAFAVDVGQHRRCRSWARSSTASDRWRSSSPWRYLFRATRARRPGMPQIALILAAVGAVGFGRGPRPCPRSRATSAPAASSTPSTSRTPPRSDALSPHGHPRRPAHLGDLRAGARLRLRDHLRSTRCASGCSRASWACSGVIVGVAVAPILPIDQQGIIRVFWLAALGVLFLGRLAERHRPRRGRPAKPSRGRPSSSCASSARRRGPRRDAAAEDGEPETPRASRRGTPATPPPKAPSPRRPDPAAAGSEHSRVEEEEAQAALLSG